MAMLLTYLEVMLAGLNLELELSSFCWCKCTWNIF